MINHGLQQWDGIVESAMPSEGGVVLRRFVSGENITVGRIAFEAGAVTPEHEHANEQFSLVLSGLMEFVVDGNTVMVRPGDVLHLPSGIRHGARAIEPSVVLDMFSPPRADWVAPK